MSGRIPVGLAARLTESLSSLWAEYAGSRPDAPHTDIRGNTVTCVLPGAVGDFDLSMANDRSREVGEGPRRLTPATYRREAVAAVVGLTRQRVIGFVSSHDRDTDVATEIFTLEPSLRRGRDGRARHDGQG